MTKRQASSSRTHPSLVKRIRRLDDHESWQAFFNKYRGLLYAAGLKAGLSDSESQDVVQDTLITVSKKMEAFKYDPAVDSFRGWLLYLTRKRIALEYRKRARGRPQGTDHQNESTVEIEAIPDPARSGVEQVWEKEMHNFMWNEAIKRVRGEVAFKQFQMFDLYVVKELPAREVARALGVEVAQVYLAKHRVSALVKHELQQLKAKLE